jgi:hypothetical protein
MPRGWVARQTFSISRTGNAESLHITPLPYFVRSRRHFPHAAARRHRGHSGGGQRQSIERPACSGRISGFWQLWTNGNPRTQAKGAWQRYGHPYVLFSAQPFLRVCGFGVISPQSIQASSQPLALAFERGLETPGGYHYGQATPSIGFWGFSTLRSCVCTDARSNGYSFIRRTFRILDF